MATVAQPSVISQVVRALPGPLLALLDSWSHRVARRRAEQRQRLWLTLQVAVMHIVRACCTACSMASLNPSLEVIPVTALF